MDELAPLYEAVDPDALEALVSHAPSASSRRLTVAFQYDEYTVTVDSGGRIDLSERTH